jgi:hypothetical protein
MQARMPAKGLLYARQIKLSSFLVYLWFTPTKPDAVQFSANNSYQLKMVAHMCLA